MKKQSLSIVGAAVALLLSSAAHATAVHKTASGSVGDLTWEAQSLIVGMTPTAEGAGPRFPGQGDPIFSNNLGAYTGVVPIIMFYEGVGSFICTATLLPDRVSLLTAAHCVSDGAGTPGPNVTTAYFQQNLGPSDRPSSDGVATPITVSQYFVNNNYTGQVIDHNDIAVLRLSAPAPAWADSYQMSFDAGLRGTDFTVAGYGNRSTVGGSGATGGATAGTTGFLRHGDNMYDFRFGDAIFGSAWYSVVGPQSRTEFSYVSDFDNGVAANDTACRTSQAGNILGAGNTTFCDLGRGATEVSVAGGDSGGPQFNAAGQIVSVTSYGLSFGTNFGDCRTGLQSSCGEFNGFVPLYIHQDFITAAMIPEPETYALMLLGLGAIGAVARRRRQTA